MFFRHITLYIIIFFSFASCNSIISLKENVNKKKRFENNEEYISSISRDNYFQKEKIIVLDDHMFNELLNEIIYKHLSTYYSITNSKYFTSCDQLQIKSCAGQIENLYKMFTSNSKELIINQVSESTIYSKFNLDDSKNTIIFLYSYKLGGLSNSKINEVIKIFEKEEKFDYRIISLDNYDILKK